MCVKQPVTPVAGDCMQAGEMTPRVLWVFVVNVVLFTVSVYLYTYTPARVVPLAATPAEYIAQLNGQRFPGDYDGVSHVPFPRRQPTDGTQHKLCK